MTDIYLRQVPEDANPADIRLYDPTQASAGGAHDITNAGAIASAEAFGSPAVDAILRPPGIASAEAFGTPTVDTSHWITDAGAIASAEAIGTPSVEARIDAVGIASAEAIGTPDLAVRIDAAGIASAEAIGVPTVSTGYQISDAGAIASAEAFGTPDISLAPPAEVPSGGFVRKPRRPMILPPVPPMVWPEWIVKDAGGIVSAEVFGTPSIVVGPRPRRLRERELIELRRAA